MPSMMPNAVLSQSQQQILTTSIDVSQKAAYDGVVHRKKVSITKNSKITSKISNTKRMKCKSSM